MFVLYKCIFKQFVDKQEIEHRSTTALLSSLFLCALAFILPSASQHQSDCISHRSIVSTSWFV